MKTVKWLFFLSQISSVAYANIGLPTLLILEPLFILFFIPIVLIEWLVCRAKTPELEGKRGLKIISSSNLISTIFGIPITWIILVLIQIYLIPGGTGSYRGFNPFWYYFLSSTVQAAWLSTDGNSIITFLACSFLLIPFYFMSAAVESAITIRCLDRMRKSDAERKEQIYKIVKDSNKASYVFMFCVISFYIILNNVMFRFR